eukprot:UN31207
MQNTPSYGSLLCTPNEMASVDVCSNNSNIVRCTPNLCPRNTPSYERGALSTPQGDLGSPSESSYHGLEPPDPLSDSESTYRGYTQEQSTVVFVRSEPENNKERERYKRSPSVCTSRQSSMTPDVRLPECSDSDGSSDDSDDESSDSG